MKLEEQNGIVTISPEGRINTSNAPELEKEFLEAADRYAGMEFVIDAKDLVYISSSGLRILMKMRSKEIASLRIINVSRDVYDIFETTGFTEIFDVRKAYRKISVDGLDVLGVGFYGTVYRLDAENIVKVYKGKDSIPMIENEKKMAKKAFLCGIPTAISYDIVQVGEDYGSVFELLNAKNFNDLVVEKEMPFDQIITKFTDLLKLMHQTEVEPGTFPSYREKFLEHLNTIRKYLPEETFRKVKKLLADVPEGNTVVHGDVQMRNVMMVGDEAMLIDMDTLGQGDPIYEWAGLYMAYQKFKEDDPGNSKQFFGFDDETADDIWNRVFVSYFSSEDEEKRKETLEKIRLAAAVRFMFILEITDLKNGELGALRLKHNREEIEELADKVKSLKL